MARINSDCAQSGALTGSSSAHRFEVGVEIGLFRRHRGRGGGRSLIYAQPEVIRDIRLAGSPYLVRGQSGSLTGASTSNATPAIFFVSTSKVCGGGEGIRGD